MKRLFILGCAIAVLSLVVDPRVASAASGPSAAINGTAAGPTPFISNVDMTISPANGLKNIEFMIEPKLGSVTRPVVASYSAAYLKGRGFLNTATGALTLPVFGLYQGYSNSVTITTDFASGRSQEDTLVITTAPWADPTGGAYLNPTVVQARTNSTDLNYDFIMLKGFTAGISPIIVDSDAEVRWVGTSGLSSISNILYENGIYQSNGTGVTRMEFDGAFTAIADYSGLGVTNAGHHQYDRGRDGILVEVDTVEGVESTVIEIDAAGNVLKQWKLADILNATMIAGGDDPSAFVRASVDWFHNNACTYSAHDNTLILSGREVFVIGLDYDTGAVKWILGDPTKAWHSYASLRKFELALTPGSLPPIGHHAVSITHDRQLMLFDNGRASFNHDPIGEDRTYSAPRKYRINERKMTADETWNYQASPSIYSPYCSSAYEDGRDSYLFDFTLGTGSVIGLAGRNEDQVFHYQYSTAAFCGISWNAAPIHLENMKF